MRWLDRTFIGLCREFRWSYLPPLMVYVAAGVQGLTAIVGTFFVKDYLGLSAEFLAALGFWLTLPWALKMPVGHLVDLIWRYKSALVYLGAGLIACSLLIMTGLLTDIESMRRTMPAEAWFVLSALLAPIGYMLQDVVADAMTVEAVPRVDERGQPVSEAERKLGNVTMQTLGRVAIIGGTVLVSLVNLYVFDDVKTMSAEDKRLTYAFVYQLALVIPLISVLGVLLARTLQNAERRRLQGLGLTQNQIDQALHVRTEAPKVNWWILGGSAVFVAFSVTMGLKEVKYGQEIIFVGSMAIILFLMSKLLRELDTTARNTLIGTAFLIFVYRALPGVGPGASWWQIDVLKFDEQFFSVLSLISTTLTLIGLFLFRRFMAEKSIAFVIGFLTLVLTLLSLPMLGMVYGLHEWTAARTGGVVDARFIAVVNETLESPFGQIAMVPMLAWIAHSAPDKLKATYFAVMASFTNLALALSQLGTKWLNQFYTITREVKDAATGAVKVAANYSDLGPLVI
ncbi:MAG: folate/biopterin family MFS transporter, partial [Betaproteobacteria bacterium]|nr:folate/biopterin family MFS transporter [Betaproteobacteria bacterium]